MGRNDSQPDGVWQYKASWRSKGGTLTLAVLFFGAVFALAAVVGRQPGMWVAGAICAGFAWLLGKPLFTREWILRIGPRGVSSYALKNRTIPWRDLRDVGVETVQGNQFVVLTLAPNATESLEKTRRWASGRKPERRIPLVAMHRKVIPDATRALQETFTERASEHAVAAIEARRQEAKFEAEFAQRMVQQTRVTWGLYLVVALNVGVWLLNVAKGVSGIAPTSPDLFRWGANSAWAVAREHEYWRLLTAAFLHAGFIHLAMNMLGLWSAGQLLNRLYGNGQFLMIYLASALAGSAASLHFAAQSAVAVGASGAVFGVLGALLMATRSHRELLPKAMSKQVMSSQGVFMAYALLNGFTHRGIDNAAHVGGLLGGAAMGALLAVAVDAGAEEGRRRLRALAASAVLALGVGVVVATTPSPRVDHRAMFASDAQMQQVMPRLQAAHAALAKDVKAAQSGGMSEAQFTQALVQVHLPALKSLLGEVDRIPRAAGDPRAGVLDDMQQITAKTVEGLELGARAGAGGMTPADQARSRALQHDIEVIGQRLKERTAALTPKKSR